MSREFSFNLQNVVESDMACADGVCFMPAATTEVAEEDNPAAPPRD